MELEGFPIALFPCSWSSSRSCSVPKFTERSSSMSKNRRNANALLSPRRLAILFGAILLSMALTSCGKKNQEGEEKTVQKSEDDFLDKDAKPDERKYLLAAKPFFISAANRTYDDTYARLYTYAITRMSVAQFKPAEQHSESQQKQLSAFDNATAEQFASL